MNRFFKSYNSTGVSHERAINIDKCEKHELIPPGWFFFCFTMYNVAVLLLNIGVEERKKIRE